jgi:hypothetical protein
VRQRAVVGSGKYLRGPSAVAEIVSVGLRQKRLHVDDSAPREVGDRFICIALNHVTDRVHRGRRERQYRAAAHMDFAVVRQREFRRKVR